jgi:3-hydroxyisobutyrate dehydrogenase
MPFALVEPGQTRIGFIGTGVMGSSMCRHLMAAGYSMTIRTRTRSKAQPLLDAGAAWADSPRAVAEKSDVVFSIVGYPHDVREVILGQHGVLGGLKSGGIVVDMTTSEPALAIGIADAARKKGIGALDAPVSGGDVGAKNATLSIMVGGDKAAFEAVLPLLQCMGKTIVWQGGPGAGQHTKLVNQILIAGALNGVCEALLYAKKAGLDPKVVLESVSGGAAASWQLQNLGPRILNGDFEPGFFAEHFVKDMSIALDSARQMKVALPGLALVAQQFEKVLAAGLAKKGTQALMLVLEKSASG